MAKSSPFGDDVLSGSGGGVFMFLLAFLVRLGMQGPIAWTSIVYYETWNRLRTLESRMKNDESNIRKVTGRLQHQTLLSPSSPPSRHYSTQGGLKGSRT
jgi:hypothetical protein